MRIRDEYRHGKDQKAVIKNIKKEGNTLKVVLADDEESTTNLITFGSNAFSDDSYSLNNHNHGLITNAGAIGATANLPLITTTNGVITTGSFGKTANTFCLGNDSRLSDSRTPTSHSHGNITNEGALQTNDITIANGDKLIVTDSNNDGKIARTSISFDGSTKTQALTKCGTWETFNNYSHPTGDGNLHVPATGTTNNGKFLMAGSTAESLSWGTPTDTASAANNILAGSNNGTLITYAPYSATTANSDWVKDSNNAGKLYLGTLNPSKDTRLNYNGDLYANKLYSDGTEVLTSHLSLKGYVTGSSLTDNSIILGNKNSGVKSSLIYIATVINNDPTKTASTTENNASNTYIPTNLAVKNYVDGRVAGATNYLGTVTALTGLSTDAKKGDFYRVSSTIAAATGSTAAHVSDMLIAEQDSPSLKIDGANWSIIHGEIDTNTWTANATNAAGYVPASGTTAFKVYASNANANASWLDLWKATNSVVGGIKLYAVADASAATIAGSTSNTDSTTDGKRNYAVKLDSNGIAYVTVPWYNNTYTVNNNKLTLAIGASGTGTSQTPSGNDTFTANVNADKTYYIPLATLATSGGTNTWGAVKGNYANTTGFTQCPVIGGIVYYKDTNTTYSTATSSVLGLVKVGATLSDTSSYTACPIKDGVIYYPNNATTASSIEPIEVFSGDFTLKNSWQKLTLKNTTGLSAGTYVIHIQDSNTDNTNYYSGIITFNGGSARMDEVALHSGMATSSDTAAPTRIFAAIKGTEIYLSSMDSSNDGASHILTIKLARII